MQPHDRPEVSNICWSAPVDLRLAGGGHRVFRGPCDALCYLVHEWPMVHGIYYETAKSTCIEALRHTRSAEEARQAFLSAMMEGAPENQH